MEPENARFFEQCVQKLQQIKAMPDPRGAVTLAYEISNSRSYIYREPACKDVVIKINAVYLKIASQWLNAKRQDLRHSAEEVIGVLLQSFTGAFSQDDFEVLFKSFESSVRSEMTDARRSATKASEIERMFGLLQSTKNRIVRQYLFQLLSPLKTVIALEQWVSLINSKSRYLNHLARKALRTHLWHRPEDCDACRQPELWLKFVYVLHQDELQTLVVEKLMQLHSPKGIEAAFDVFKASGSSHARHLRKALAKSNGADKTLLWANLLVHERSHIRWNAAMALKKMPPNSDARLMLLNALNDPKLKVQLAAVRTLAHWQEKSAFFLGYLWKGLHSPHGEAKVSVLDAIATIGWMPFAPFIINFVHHPHIGIRLAAIRSIKKLRYSGARELLISLIANTDESAIVRIAALQAARRLIPIKDFAEIKIILEKTPEFNFLLKKYRNHVDDWKYRLFSLDLWCREKYDWPRSGFRYRFSQEEIQENIRVLRDLNENLTALTSFETNS